MKYRIQESSFLGAPIDPQKHYTIIGAGIAGLYVGYFLKKAGVSFEIHEITDRAGGLLDSHDTEFGRVEQAANGFIWCPELAEICQTLDLEITGPKPSAKARYLLRKNTLRRFPLSPVETIQFVSKILSRQKGTVRTLEDFGLQHLGEKATRQILEPAFAGIYGADIKQLSFPGTIAGLAEGLNKHDRLIGAIRYFRQQRKAKSTGKSPRGTHGFAHGIGQLPKQLAVFLDTHIHYGSDGLKLDRTDRSLILCTPAHVSARYAEGSLSELLKKVFYTPILSVTAHVKRSDCPGFKPGFGCLIPRSEGYTSLGVLFNSSIFPNRSRSEEILSLTFILRADEQAPDLLERSDAAIQELVQSELGRLFGFQGTILQIRCFRWPQGIPLYSPALYEQLPEMDRLARMQGLNLFGNYTGQISIRGMSQTAARLLDH
ncbi:MAG: FAD-dependent oxidoreductase [Bacteroidota bacterium]